MSQRVIKNARVAGLEEPVQIVIEDERILTITPKMTSGSSGDIDAQGRLVLPGLINIHAHLDKSGLAVQIPNKSGSITEARQKVLEAKSKISREEIFERAKRTALMAVQDGVTAIRTHVDVDPSIGLKGIEALVQLRNETKRILDLQIVAFPQEGITEAPGTFDLMYKALKLGADIVGGHLSIAKDYREHTERVFELATQFNREIDIHVDYDIDRNYQKTSRHEDGIEYPDELGVVSMAEETIHRGFGGRAIASHLCGLDSLPHELAQKVIDLIVRSKVAVVALPPNNLYMHGRSDLSRVRRGVTKVRALREAGVPVAFGTDNIRDPFNPLGNSNMIQNATLTAYACHMASTEDFMKTIDMCTYEAARLMKLPDYGLQSGCYADITILDAPSIDEALATQAIATHVFKRGRLVATNEIKRTFFSDPA